MIILAVYLAIAISYAREKRSKLVQSLKKRPNIKYVKARILVASVFKKHFSEVKRLAKKIITPAEPFFDWRNCDERSFRCCIPIKSLRPEEPMKDNGGCHKSSFNALELSFSQVTTAIGGILGTETALLERMDHLVGILMAGISEKYIMEKAVRFEIKKNCLKNPYDIIGAQLCKIIESAFEDSLRPKETPSRFHLWHACIKRSLIHIKDQMLSMLNQENTWRTAIIGSLVLFGAGVLSLAIYLLMRYEFWLEGGLLLFLLLVNGVIVVALQRHPLYSRYTLFSMIRCISKIIFLTVGVYLYDYASDIQVLKAYASVKSCHGHSTVIVKPIIALGILIFIASSISIIPSFLCIKNQIKVSLFLEGTVKPTPEDIQSYSPEQQSSEKKENEESISTKSIMSRNELSITEAGIESTYQVMVQWGLYFSIHYWIYLSNVANEVSAVHANHTDVTNNSWSKFYTEPNMTQGNFFFSPDNICGIKDQFTFGILWKSGIISLLSLSLAQRRANDVQHELSIDTVQKIFYFMASVCNTLSHATLLVLFGTNMFDFLSIIRDTLYAKGFSTATGVFVAVMFYFVWVLSPVLWIFAINIITKRICKNAPTSENVDTLTETPEDNTDSCFTKVKWRLNCAYGFYNIQCLHLPTSLQPKFQFSIQQRRITSHHISYHTPNCPQLLTAFITQCIAYIITLVDAAFFGLLNLYLLSEDGNLEKLTNISPTNISSSRHTFLINCCVTIPLGLILSYLFLYLYFKFDGGYFRVSRLQYEYSQRKPAVENIGEWVDLSGQEHSPDLNTNDTTDENKDVDFVVALNLNDSEKILFEEIKSSFPYYRKY